jgi:hypothetical protein
VRDQRRGKKEKRKRTAERERGESERREKKEKEEKPEGLREEVAARVSRVLFFLFYMFMRVNAGRGGYPQGKNVYTRNPPHPHGLDKIQPESAQKHSKSGWIGAGR